MEKRTHKFKKIKDFFSLQTFEILYINPIKSFVPFAVKFKMNLNKLLNKAEYFSFTMAFHSADEHIFEKQKTD